MANRRSIEQKIEKLKQMATLGLAESEQLLSGDRRHIWPAPEGELVDLRDAIGDLPPIPRAQRSERGRHDFQDFSQSDIKIESDHYAYTIIFKTRCIRMHDPCTEW